MIKVYTDDQQKLFRRVLDNHGAEKESALRELIEQQLDEESAIISWLKRNHNYDFYLKLKNDA